MDRVYKFRKNLGFSVKCHLFQYRVMAFTKILHGVYCDSGVEIFYSRSSIYPSYFQVTPESQCDFTGVEYVVIFDEFL